MQRISQTGLIALQQSFGSHLYFRHELDIMARPAIPGEKVINHIDNNMVETMIAKDGETIVRDGNISALVKTEKFLDRIVQLASLVGDLPDEDGFTRFTVRGAPLKMFRLGPTDEFIVSIPDLGDVEIRGGDVIYEMANGNLMTIPKDDFNSSYRPCNSDGHIFSAEEIKKAHENCNIPQGASLSKEEELRIHKAMRLQSDLMKVFDEAENKKPTSPAPGI